IEHDKGHIEGMGIRKGGNQHECAECKDEEEKKGTPGRDKPCRDWPCPEYTPGFCEPAELCVFPVILTVDVIIQDKSAPKSKEAYKKDPEKIRPREEAIRGGGKEI